MSQGLLPAVWHPEYSYPFSEKHRFVMAKFALLMQHLQDTGLSESLALHRPGACPTAWLHLAHCSRYIDQCKTGTLPHKALRRLGLPWSEALIRRSLLSPTGTIYAAQLALKEGLACHLAGGTHHAHHDYGAGFCLFNDLAICALKLLQQKNVKRVLIFDCDVHQGDGTARILRQENSAFTCSLHCEKNFPVNKAQSDYDVNLPKHMQDDDYLDVCLSSLKFCLHKHRPDIVLYDAGVDVFSGDPLGLLSISEQGIQTRDHIVLSECLREGVPVASVIGGGYDNNHSALAKRHAIIVQQALKVWRNQSH